MRKVLKFLVSAAFHAFPSHASSPKQMSRPSWRKGQAPSASTSSTSTASSTALALSASASASAGGAGTLTTALAAPIAQLAPDAPFTTNPYESTGAVFFDACQEFANACAEVWPSDAAICNEASRLSSIGETSEKVEEGLRLARGFHAAFVDNYALVTSKDGSFFSLPHEVLVAVSAANKYASAPADVRETVWEYMRSLVQYAGMVDMYAKCPQAMLDSISGVAGGLIAKLQSGELDANSLNPLQLGQMMMQEMSGADLESFGNAIMEGGNMESMMSIMQSTMAGMNMGGMGGAAAGGGGAAGMPDLSMLASLFGK